MTVLSAWLQAAQPSRPVAGARRSRRSHTATRRGESLTATRRGGRRIAARILTSLHERMLGRPTLELARSLERSQWLSPDALRELQAAKLQRLIRHAARHCPYYRDRLTRAHTRLESANRHSAPHGVQPPSAVDLERIATLDDLTALPLLSRDALRRHAAQMRRDDSGGRILIDHTHGTTDAPFAYYWDRRRQAWDKANRLRAHAWHSFDLGDRELHLWPVDPPCSRGAAYRHWLRRGRDRLLGDHQIDSLNLSPSRSADCLNRWSRFNPQRATAYPSALFDLLQGGLSSGCRFHSPELRCVFLTGEVTFPWQRRLFAQTVGAPVVQMYGVQEAGALAFECEHRRWHVCAESAIVEIIRAGRPARPGELGEIVVTGLESAAMPVIRYCTGDIVRAETLTCRCGRGLPVMPAVLGRAGDFLMADDGRWIPPVEVVDALADLLDAGAFQVFQDDCGAVEVRVVGPAEPAPAVKAEARRRLGGLVGRDLTCRVAAVAALSRAPFGKRRYVQSRRTLAGLARSGSTNE